MIGSWAPLGTGAADLVLRATILLAGAALLAWTLRRGAAGPRHVLWTATFVALLALPLGVFAGVGWELPVLPGNAGSVDRGRAPAPVSAGEVSPVISESALPSSAVEGEPAREKAAGARTPGESAGGGSWLATLRRGTWSWPLALWLVGVAGALGSLLIGAARLRRRVRDARPVRDPRWLGRLAALRRELGIRREVRLLMSPEAASPMTAGWQRPVIVVPESASAWPAARRDVVLAHELVHVRRNDVPRHVLGRVALAFYWFHPLGWLASRLARSSREQACDERVLDLGVRPSEYARHLLDLAEDMGPDRPEPALAMVQRSQLEKRIMAILDPTPRRAGRVASSLALIVVGALGLSAATARPVPVDAARAGQDAGQLQDEGAELDGVVRQRQATPRSVAPEGTGQAPSPDRLPRVIQGIGGAPSGGLIQDGGSPAGEISGIVQVQEAGCRAEGLRGSFSGTLSTGGGRTAYSGWHNGDRMIQKYVDDLRLCMRIHGDVVMADDGLSVRAVGADSWVALESEEDDLHRLVITEGSEGIEYAWSVNGGERAFDAEARAWRDRMFTVLRGYWEASRLRGQESSLRGRISSARGHVSSLRGQISSARGHVSSLNGQISSARGRVSSLRGRISSLRGRVSGMSGSISSHRGRISSLRSAARSVSDPDTREGIEEEIARHEAEIRRIEREIEEFDVEARVAEVRAELDAYDVEARVRELEREIEEYDVEDRIRAIEREIEDYDLDGRVRALEREIDELNAERRAAAIERDLEPEIEALRRLIDGM